MTLTKLAKSNRVNKSHVLCICFATEYSITLIPRTIQQHILLHLTGINAELLPVRPKYAVIQFECTVERLNIRTDTAPPFAPYQIFDNEPFVWFFGYQSRNSNLRESSEHLNTEFGQSRKKERLQLDIFLTIFLYLINYHIDNDKSASSPDASATMDDYRTGIVHSIVTHVYVVEKIQNTARIRGYTVIWPRLRYNN